MSMLIFKDEEILDLGFRKKIIEEIDGPENKARRAEMFRRYEIFRDQVSKYVIQRLADQGFSEETLLVMKARASNLSIAKKIIKKKARAYNAGVERIILNNAEATYAIEKLASELGVTEAFAKADQYRQLSKNALIYCRPIIDEYIGDIPYYKFTSIVLHPHLFDVIPDAQDRECAKCVILSNFPAGQIPIGLGQSMSNYEGVRGSYVNYGQNNDGIDQTIANSASDKGANKKQYVWWTKTYHFTTNDKGQIINDASPEDLVNPIQMLPFVSLAMDQDGGFWGNGGQDIIEGTLRANILLTDNAAILNAQGWGQPVMTGEDLKGDYKIGPQNVIQLSYRDGQPKPTFELVSTNPHTDNWLRTLEMDVALLLTTNNLSPRNIQGTLNANSVASGVAKLIDEAESIDDITESQAYYRSKELEYWKILSAWIELYRNAGTLSAELDMLPQFDPEMINVRFKQLNIVQSEQDKLLNIKLRKELGLNTQAELIRMADDSLSHEEAEAKAVLIAQQRQIAVPVISEMIDEEEVTR